MQKNKPNKIWIFGDNDKSFCGQSKAYALANRLVTQYKRKVNMMIPDETGYDYNDLHRDMMRSGYMEDTYLKPVK